MMRGTMDLLFMRETFQQKFYFGQEMYGINTQPVNGKCAAWAMINFGSKNPIDYYYRKKNRNQNCNLSWQHGKNIFLQMCVIENLRLIYIFNTIYLL